uniref:Uncharacterized protein n=1 Tax=uncultured Desulfobacterium sp. TaxID=201089 RepID=E1Y863_9BACT|nr:unknown protein [uncultured Desulfobacterium sp.]
MVFPGNLLVSLEGFNKKAVLTFFKIAKLPKLPASPTTV